MLTNTYASVHSRLFRERGPAANHPCSACGAPAAEWAYDGADPDAQVGRCDARGGVAPYSLDLARYAPLCITCHRLKDGNVNRDKTHCPQGHPYDSANTYINPAGARTCRACRAKRERSRRRLFGIGKD